MRSDIKEYSVVTAGLADYQKIASLHHLSHSLSFREFAPKSWTASRNFAEYRASWSSMLDSQTSRERTWIALKDTHVIGTVTIQNLENCSSIFRPSGLNGIPVSDVACLRLMYVHPEYMRKGVGRALIQELIKFCNQNGYRLGSLITHAANARARRFYESQDWRLDEIFQSQVKEFFNEPLSMRKRARYQLNVQEIKQNC